MLNDPHIRGLTVRLADRFGDHGLIAVVIGELHGNTLDIDTWVMSCRVLKRQVEEETLNAIVRLANSLGAETVRGHYLPTARNGMVRDLYPRMGFRQSNEAPDRITFELDPRAYEPKPTKLHLEERI
jgi:FkbH-like protein